MEETNIRAQFPFTRVEEMEKSSRILLLLRDFNQSTEITSILQKRLKLLKRCIDWLIRDTCVTGYQVTREKARFACKIDGYRFKKNLKSHANSPVSPILVDIFAFSNIPFLLEKPLPQKKFKIRTNKITQLNNYSLKHDKNERIILIIKVSILE